MVEVFRDRGYASTSLADLTARAGVGRQSLYDTFGSKDRLWGLALTRYRERQGQAMLGWLDDEDVVEGIRQVLYWLIDDTCADPRGCLVVAAAAERVPANRDSTAQVSEQFAAIADALAVAIRRGQAAGQIPAGVDAIAHAELLLTLMQGMRVVGKVRADADRMRRTVDVTLELLQR